MCQSLLLATILVFAAALYTFRLGAESLGASETYSVAIANQPDAARVLQSALAFDPGKPPLYHLALHSLIRIAGDGEAPVRALSVIFAVIGIALVYAIGSDLFGAEAAWIGAVLWAANPLACLLAQWARMYTMYTTLVLLVMLSLLRVTRRPSASGAIVLALSVAATLYTHLGGLGFLAAACAILIRDRSGGRWNRAAWLGVGLGVLLFTPFVPQALSQTRGLISGHWLDWIGAAATARSPLLKIVVGTAAIALVMELTFGRAYESEAQEPIRFCLLWLMIPTIGLGAASVIVRPLFAVRYIAPAGPAVALILARGLCAIRPFTRRLATALILALFMELFVFYQQTRYDPWRDIARIVAAGRTSGPVFFEPGLVVVEGERGTAASPFPQGYFRVPFDHYSRSPNPRATLPGPEQSADRIARAARARGGAWLISGKPDQQARAEMPPASGGFIITKMIQAQYATLYLIEPAR